MAGEEGRCERHEAVAQGACARCGRFYCSACAGRGTRESYCEECDARLGRTAWERGWHAAQLSGFILTVANLLRHPLRSAEELPLEGPVGPPLRFAALCWAVLVPGCIARSAMAYALQSRALMDGLGSGASVFVLLLRGDAIVDVLREAIGIPLAGAGAFVIVYVALGHLEGTLRVQSAVRWVSYGAAFLALVWIPVLGWIAPLVLVRFAKVTLVRRAGLDPGSAWAVVGASALWFAISVGGVAMALRPLGQDLVSLLGLAG